MEEKRTCQIKWRATESEFEFFVRSIYPKKINDAERARWLPKDWRDRLETLRRKQRQDAVPDSAFEYGAASRKVAA